MFRRTAWLWAGLGVLAAYGLAYLLAWSVIWRVPVHDRDGIEGIFVIGMTMPWSLLFGVGGVPVIHAGAAINSIVMSRFFGREVRRRWSGTGGSG